MRRFAPLATGGGPIGRPLLISFAEELAHCFVVLAESPEIGKRYRRQSAIPAVRRVLLRATRYHVYYVPGSDAVAVLAVWHSHRGQSPTL